ncbi:MAG: glycosyltransferase [Pseudomonadota bacterium]
MPTPRPSDAPPKLSVAIAAYNAERFLAEALDSVLAQTFSDFELLVHDDGSTDGTLSILERYAQRDARVIVTSGPNRGLAHSLNAMVARARAPLIARMDADDLCLPERFARQVPYFDEDPSLAVLGSGWVLMDEAGRPIKTFSVATEHEQIDSLNLCGRTALAHPSTMIRKAPLIACGGYDETCPCAQDLELWLRIAEHGTLRNLPEPLIWYRVHDNSVSGQKQQLQQEISRRACEAAWQRRGVEGTYRFRMYRPADPDAPRMEYTLRYGWDAWREGYRSTWRHYALEAMRTDPLSRAAWRLALYGWLRRPQPGKTAAGE